MSYICRGLPNHIDTMYTRTGVLTILNDCNFDIVCLQETWFTKQDLAILNNLHPDFDGIGQSTVDNTAGLRRGHAPGGVAIMWRSRLDKNITPLEFDVNWLTGIRLRYGNHVYMLLCVYMLYECRDNEDI